MCGTSACVQNAVEWHNPEFRFAVTPDPPPGELSVVS